MPNEYYYITAQFLHSIGSSFIQKQSAFTIKKFFGVRKINELDVRPLKPETKELLVKRGELYIKYGTGTQFAVNNGTMFTMGSFGPIYFKGDGRVMIDYQGMVTSNPRNDVHGSFNNPRGAKGLDDGKIKELLYTTWPTLHAFSFTTKRWGEIFVDNITDIVFDDHAFDKLVIDPERKRIASALVKNVKHGFKDIITDKSGGVIFLLEGPPGTGKTLTCEALSEYQHKPLYSVTVGEIGITPDEVEKKLVTLLELCNRWNANILIDEADVFMEKRDVKELTRNAMVCVFLRLLERYSGVMFLTTNRSTTIDDAVKSRISVTFKYENLDQDKRRQVWTNLCEYSKVSLTVDEINMLSRIELNGRQIKNAIRIAQCYSKEEGMKTGLAEIKLAIELM